MTHEPECDRADKEWFGPNCQCEQLRAAYLRGFTDATAQMVDAVDEVSYRRGYNDHARSQQEKQRRQFPTSTYGGLWKYDKESDK